MKNISLLILTLTIPMIMIGLMITRTMGFQLAPEAIAALNDLLKVMVGGVIGVIAGSKD